jgi:hypothetical protein
MSALVERRPANWAGSVLAASSSFAVFDRTGADEKIKKRQADNNLANNEMRKTNTS